MSYTERLRLYEQLKAKIKAEARTAAEYEKRVKALARKLNI